MACLLHEVPAAVLQGVASRNELWPWGHEGYLEILHMELLPVSAGLGRAGEFTCSAEFLEVSARDPGEAGAGR